MYKRGTDLDKKEERTFNKCSVYENVDVQLYWKLLVPVWKATDNSVFCKLIPHPHSSNQEECVAYETRYIIYYNHIDSNRFIECHFE